MLRDGSDAAFVEFLRSTRSQVFRTEINPNWIAGFEEMRDRAHDAVVDKSRPGEDGSCGIEDGLAALSVRAADSRRLSPTRRTS